MLLLVETPADSEKLKVDMDSLEFYLFILNWLCGNVGLRGKKLIKIPTNLQIQQLRMAIHSPLLAFYHFLELTIPN